MVDVLVGAQGRARARRRVIHRVNIEGDGVGTLLEVNGDEVAFERVVRDTAGNEMKSKVVKR